MQEKLLRPSHAATLWSVGVALLAAVSLIGPPAQAAHYSYSTSPSNPLQDLPPLTAGPDFIHLEFTTPFRLAPNSVYDISTAAGPPYVTTWSAKDSLFGITLDGTDAPIALSPAPGLLPGGALTFCNTSPAPCFGGAVATDSRGRITAWNLVADAAPGQPFLTFISYDNAYLGSLDGLGSVQGGTVGLAINDLNGPAGSWTPEPVSWSLWMTGLAGLGAAMRSSRAATRTRSV